MDIIIGKNSGFCNGVAYTVNKTKELLKDNKVIYSLGELFHNKDVINELEKEGLITVSSIDEIPSNSKVIIRAHGESLETYEKAQEKNLEIFDLTCGKIKVIHKQVLNNNDKYIIIIGKHDHPETIGTKGHTKYSYVVSSITDIKDCYKDFLKSHRKEIYIISQTTFNSLLFDEIVNNIKETFKDIPIEVNKSICNATTLRQKEVIELSKKCNKMIIIGGRNSSNTKELYNLAKENTDTYLIENYHDLNFKINREDIIGIMAGASTSDDTVKKVIKTIEATVK